MPRRAAASRARCSASWTAPLDSRALRVDDPSSRSSTSSSTPSRFAWRAPPAARAQPLEIRRRPGMSPPRVPRRPRCISRCRARRTSPSARMSSESASSTSSASKEELLAAIPTRVAEGAHRADQPRPMRLRSSTTGASLRSRADLRAAPGSATLPSLEVGDDRVRHTRRRVVYGSTRDPGVGAFEEDDVARGMEPEAEPVASALLRARRCVAGPFRRPTRAPRCRPQEPGPERVHVGDRRVRTPSPTPRTGRWSTSRMRPSASM